MSETTNVINGSVQRVEVGVSGAAVFWELASRSDYSALAKGLEANGFKDFIPESRTPLAALKSAMCEVWGGSGVLIRPLSDPEKDGFTAVQEIRGDSANSYVTLVSVKIDPAGKLEIVNGQGQSVPDAARLQLESAWVYQLAILSNTVVTSVLVKILTTDPVDGGLGGTVLRPSGGLYWVPATQIPKLEQVVNVVRDCGLGNKPNTIYILRVVYDKDSVSAVRDAIIREVQQTAGEIKARANQQGLGERAYRTMAAEAKNLHARLAMYEGILKQSMNEFHDLATATENNVMDLAANALPDIFGAPATTAP